MVSELAFCSDDPNSITAEVYYCNVRELFVKKKSTKIEAGDEAFKK